jgi:hypothetical protein
MAVELRVPVCLMTARRRNPLKLPPHLAKEALHQTLILIPQRAFRKASAPSQRVLGVAEEWLDRARSAIDGTGLNPHSPALQPTGATGPP